MNRTSAENAIHTWLRLATGIPAARILWWHQRFERPSGTAPWISIQRTRSNEVGRGYLHRAANPTPSPGAELLYTTGGDRVWQLSINCVGVETTGDSTPMALMETAITKLRLPSIAAGFLAAQIGVLDVGELRDLSKLVNDAEIEGRAQLDITFSLADSATETGAAIASMTMTGFVPSEAAPDITIGGTLHDDGSFTPL